MSNQTDEDEVTLIPLSVVFITVGMIVLAAFGAMWWISMSTQTPIAQLIETAVPIPTIAAQTESQITEPANLLPETQEDVDYPEHYVSALEAARPYTGEPMRINIPQIELDAPVTAIGLQNIQIEGNTHYQWMVPSNFQAGWHNTSARLGQNGNTVLNGHHNIHGEVFRDLVDLNEGDRIFVEDASTSYAYEVSEILILEERNQPLAVRQENAKWIGETEDERITLVTCWPYSDNSHRVIVIAYPVDTN
jgi:LPXTG-site transpeptidase (sortase) family protein